MGNLGTRLQVFTFDKETEKHTGALTMWIFTMCLALFLLIFVAIADAGLSLVGYLIGEMTAIPISHGAILDQMDIAQVVTYCIIGANVVMFPTYGMAGLRHLLYAYAIVGDGQLVKMNWRLRRVHIAQASMLAREASKSGQFRRDTTRTAFLGIFAFFDGLDMMHNPQVVISHLDGTTVRANITTTPLDNITLVKRTRKKLVLLADTVVKEKTKRKKITIYQMYSDMDALCARCERGSSLVDG